MSDPIKSPFYDIQEAMGATFVDEGGWWWTGGFGDTDREYRAVREGVGMWDLSPLNKWEFRGPDAVEALQRVHSNDILGMAAGQVRYGAFLDEEGLLVDDGTVFRFADDHLWAMTNDSDREAYFAEAVKGLDVSVVSLGTDLPSMQIQGPGSRDLMRTITDADVDALGYFRFIPEQVAVGGVPVTLSRTGFSGELGYEVFLAPQHASAIWDAVAGAGAVPYGVDIIEAVRVETGMIVTGYDYQEHERTPFDLGLDRVVALDAPGEFMGKTALREVAKEPPNRFKTLRLEGDALPEYGAAVTRDGAEVGVLTSPAESRTLGPLGIAILRADAAADGTRLEVAAGDEQVGATVDRLALYDPKKERPRS
ncbi:MAG: aminomethyl transferase family protein [Actinobacteria bacterium]|nr:aminomethyl transferase family protein [Actinomycetota bacterium]